MANSGKGLNGKGLNGFKAASLLYDRESWGVAFHGVGAPLPGPGLYERPDPKAKKAHEKASPRPEPGEKHHEFTVLEDGPFMPTEERCAW